MKEYTKEFDGVTYTFTESDLYWTASYVLKRFKNDLVEAKKWMGSRYTEEIDNKVQSLIDDFIVSSFKNQVDIMNHVHEWSEDVTPKNAFHRAMGIGQYAERYAKVAECMINSVSEELRLIGVPVCKQII